LGVFLLAIQAGHVMQDLIDQAHGVDLSRLHGLFRKAHQIALVVYFLSEQAGGMEICENHIAAKSIKGLIELIPVSRPTGQVKFHEYRVRWPHPEAPSFSY